MLFPMLMDKVNVTVGMTLIVFLFLFLVGSMIGYLFEVLFRRFVSAKKWVNPGFMKGPWLPLYGFGLVVMMTLVMLIVSFFPEEMPFYNPLGNLPHHETAHGPCVNDLIPLTLMWLSLILLELLAGLIFVKGFKIKLWDYSNMKFNFMGILCPVFSLVWLVAAVVFYYALFPFVYALFQRMFVYFYGSETAVAHYSVLFLYGVVYGVFFVDLVQSLGLFKRVVTFARKQKILLSYDEEVARRRVELKRKRQELWESALPMEARENLERNRKAYKEFTGKIANKLRSLVLIDPEKKKSENYGKDGRPISTEEPKDGDSPSSTD